MKKLALALMLALPAVICAPPAAAKTLSARGLPAFDGISRRATRKKSSKRVAAHGRQSARRKKYGIRDGGADVPYVMTAAAPVVTEIDGEGLKKLLERGEAATARPLLINFWATWCVPCRKEMPDLVKIDRDYRGRGLEFVVISADDVSELKTDVPKFLRQMHATMPAYLLNATDSEAAIAQVDPTWGGELPATFLFDRQGKLVFKHTGIINAARLRSEINKVMSNE